MRPMPIVQAIGAAVVALALAAAAAQARTTTDSAGRTVQIPETVARVFAAGPPAATLLYALAPQLLVGWARAPAADAKPFLLPAMRELPETGRLTGRGNTLDLDRLIAAKPDLVIDFGTVNDGYRDLADKVQAQSGIPYLLIDGELDRSPQVLRLLGGLLGVATRGEALARAAQAILTDADRIVLTDPANRPRVYLARGSDGLETTARAPMLDRAGAVNVAATLPAQQGKVSVTLAQLAELAPDAIITTDPDVKRLIAERPEWKTIAAVAAGRVFAAPGLPFGFIDNPPSINRLLGLSWLVHVLYPAQKTDIRASTRAFFNLFYQVNLDDAQLGRLLDNTGR